MRNRPHLTKKGIRSLAAVAAAMALLTVAGVPAGADSGQPGNRPSTTGEGPPLTIGMPNGTQTDNSNPFVNTSSAMSLGYGYAMYEPLAQVNAIRPAEEPTP